MGRGVAYSTTEAVHLLNVCAEGMSAWEDDPDHFAKWFGAGASYAEGFAPRRVFAKYLGEILGEAVSSGCTELIEATVVSATREAQGWRIGFDDGSSVHADAIVLATGNQEPDALHAFANAGPAFVRNPWGADAREAVQELTARGEAALIVGTGLTMVDLVLSLEAAGHCGRIVALSRRGLVPRGHIENDAVPVEADEVPHGSVRALSRWLRQQGAEVGWRAAIDSLRPHSHSLWQSLDTDQQRRFLRHARPWWDVHRHRIAPEVADTIVRLVGEGRLEIVAGRIVSARPNGSSLEVELRRRGSATVDTESVAYAFNCTGPLHSMARTKDSLLRSLLDAGEVGPDHLGIGLEVDGTCRAGEHLWAMGPLTKGRYWEIIAVPDIRDQAAEVADDIERELGA
jgi:uncharacterized NAD(P)/FAD-binding protein YdhS